MPEQLISASGVQHPLIINPDGSINVSGTVGILGSIHIGSVSANVDSIYIQSGNNITGSSIDLETSPIATNKNNPAWKFEYIISGTSSGVTGSSIGSITQFIGIGSFVTIFTWSNDLVTNIGSYS